MDKQRVEFPCGKCGPCITNQKRIWTARIQLEITQHPNTEWVTLTYRDESLPTGGTLVPSHLTGFVRALRRRLHRQGQIGLRYFGVGEYGSRTKRPHYHVFLFGLLPSQREIVRQLWKYGHCFFGHDPVNSKVAEYTAGYTVKKEGKDAEKLAGRCKEFARMSLRPPIGGQWAEKFGASLAENKYFVESLAETGFPTQVRLGGKMVPLGRTLARYVRQGLGYGEPSDAEKLSKRWLLGQLYENAEYQAERKKRRLEAAVRCSSRQRLFAKQETL